jgi:hypothetical protein
MSAIFFASRTSAELRAERSRLEARESSAGNSCRLGRAAGTKSVVANHWPGASNAEPYACVSSVTATVARAKAIIFGQFSSHENFFYCQYLELNNNGLIRILKFHRQLS